MIGAAVDILFTVNPTNGWALVTFEFDRDIIALLKTVGRGNWQYQIGTKCWYIREFKLDELTKTLESEDFVVARKTLQVSVISTSGNPYAIVFDALPDELAQRVYHALVKVLHPDRQGHLEQMKLLNVAWESRRERDA